MTSCGDDVQSSSLWFYLIKASLLRCPIINLKKIKIFRNKYKNKFVSISNEANKIKKKF